MTTDNFPTYRPSEFENLLVNLLNSPRGEDYCLNGLQLDANIDISNVLGAVTISDEVIEEAISIGAQAIVVHHGWHWKGEDARAIGARGAMIRKMLAHGISLFAFHHPLDQSPTYGNNTTLAAALNLRPMVDSRGELQTVCGGSVLLCEAEQEVTAAHITASFQIAVEDLKYSSRNKTSVTLINGEKQVKTVAICTGGAQRLFHDLQRLPSNLMPDMYITGEISLPQFYTAKESGMAYLAGGHHNTEIFGIKALMSALEASSTVSATFFNDWCPV